MTYKTAFIVFLIFILYTFIVCFIPEITQYDVEIIKYIQFGLKDVNRQIPILMGGIIFYFMTFLPWFLGCIFLFIKKLYKKMFLYSLVPFIAYFINSIVKFIVNRPRPPIELQFEEHMKSSSYVSRHTFVTACVFGAFIFLLYKYCPNKIIRNLLIILSCIWIIFEGFSRVWMGVHNPTDVLGALILSCLFLVIYFKFCNKFICKN